MLQETLVLFYNLRDWKGNMSGKKRRGMGVRWKQGEGVGDEGIALGQAEANSVLSQQLFLL